MPLKVSFLHDHPEAYSSHSLRSKPLGGTQNTVVQLAEALAARGHRVTVFNNIAKAADEYGVSWRPLADAPSAAVDCAVAVASPHTLSLAKAARKILWLHNPTDMWRQFRRGNLWPLFRHRPHLILLGAHHDANVPRWLPFRSRRIIGHGIEADLIRAEPAASPPAPRAIFTSQPYRGLRWLIGLWPEVRRQVEGAELHVFAPKETQSQANRALPPEAGIVIRGSVSRAELGRELREARVQLIPGHHHETFCLAAAEAIAGGVPVVTLGLGALKERVESGVTGLIAPSRDAFIAETARLLRDDDLWNRLHLSCLESAKGRTWDDCAAQWEDVLRPPAQEEAGLAPSLELALNSARPD
jgi:glycosyltransferase involved in cell wall biosynthesis